MKELGITKGEWIGVDYAGHYSIQVAPFYGARDLLDEDKTNEAEANMQLCCDAGNTAQKCGLLPSELLQQRDELREALVEMIWQFGYRGTYEGRENLHSGGLSALESAFDALGISDPITILDFEAAIKNTDG